MSAGPPTPGRPRSQSIFADFGAKLALAESAVPAAIVGLIIVDPAAAERYQAKTGGGFVMAADDGEAFWFVNTLTINKVGSDDTQGQLSIVDHWMPAGFAPPPHIHRASGEAFLVLDGQLEGLCGDQQWRAGPGSLVFLPRAIPHGFTVSGDGPGRIIVVVSPGGFDQFVAAAGKPAQAVRLPEPVPPDPVLLTQIAAAHGIQILPPAPVLARRQPRDLGIVPPDVRPCIRRRSAGGRPARCADAHAAGAARHG